MKTLKCLKFSAIIQAAFIALWVVAATMIWIVKCENIGTDSFVLTLASLMGVVAFLASMLPVGNICLIVGLLLYNSERKIAESKQLIGRKWLWFPALYLIMTAAWLFFVGTITYISGA